MNRLKSKVALVTGAARGLGAVMACTFAAEGAKLVLADLQQAPLAAVEARIRSAGGEAFTVRLDVAIEADWTAAIAATLQRWGGLDIVVNNAGIVPSPAAIEAREVEVWDRVMAVNVRGVFLGIKHAVPALRARGGGSIVNVSSLAALGQSSIMDAAYAASKAAVRMLSKVTAAQHAHEGIRCNSLHPGPIDSEMLRGVLNDTQAMARRLSRVPMARLGRAEEVAAAALFLASDESSFTTGAELTVDGGALVQ